MDYTDITLDMAMDAFAEAPGAATAASLIDVAQGYADDDMIGDEEAASIRAAAQPYLAHNIISQAA